MKIDLTYVEKLIKMISESDLTELTLEDDDNTITLKRNVENQVPQKNTQVIDVMQCKNEPEIKSEQKRGKPIISPMVGTFYTSSSPNTKPFVEVGDEISMGQVVCIIEAMKLMNEIESEFEGKVTEICVEDGQPVEYGQILMYVQ